MISTAVQHRGRLFRAGLAHLLAREPDVDVVGHVATAAELIDLCAARRPDAVLLEVDADVWDCARLVAALRKRRRSLRVIGVHGGLGADTGRRLHQAGVRQLISYEMGAETVVAGLRGRQLAPTVATLPVRDRLPRNVLTDREAEVLSHVAQGHRTKDIADRLGISLKTVENHKQRLFRKLDVQNQAHAVSIAMRQGLITPSAVNE